MARAGDQGWLDCMGVNDLVGGVGTRLTLCM